MISDAGPHPYFELIGAHADRERFDVRLATVGPSGALHLDAARMGLRSLSLEARDRRGYPLAVLRLARYLRRERIDVVQTHLLDGSLVGLLAARLAGTPVTILTGHHSHEIPLHDHRALTAIDRLCAGPLCHSIIAPSVQMSDTFVAVHGVAPDKVTVVHHGFELDRLDPAGVDPEAVRHELGLDGRVVIGSIGRLYWMKNQDALIRAFSALPAPEAMLLVVGAGDQAPLRELIRSSGVEGRVILLPGRPDVPHLLAAMDLYVHPAIAESFGMVIVEAMAMARPVVSTPVGVAPELLDGATGVLAEDARPESLTRALATALERRERWQSWGEEARRRALELPARDMVGRYEDEYLRLLDQSQGRESLEPAPNMAP